ISYFSAPSTSNQDTVTAPSSSATERKKGASVRAPEAMLLVALLDARLLEILETVELDEMLEVVELVETLEAIELEGLEEDGAGVVLPEPPPPPHPLSPWAKSSANPIRVRCWNTLVISFP